MSMNFHNSSCTRFLFQTLIYRIKLQGCLRWIYLEVKQCLDFGDAQAIYAEDMQWLTLKRNYYFRSFSDRVKGHPFHNHFGLCT